MSEMKWAIITGADGGMGTEITRGQSRLSNHYGLLSSEESGGCS